MILDMNTFRDILLFLESEEYYICDKHDNVSKVPVCLDVVCRQFPNLNRQEVFYALSNLSQAGFIEMSIQESDCLICMVEYITFSGHEFISSVKNDLRWDGIKKALPAIKNYSLEAISAISQGMTSAAISSYLSKNP